MAWVVKNVNGLYLTMSRTGGSTIGPALMVLQRSAIRFGTRDRAREIAEALTRNDCWFVCRVVRLVPKGARDGK